MDKTNIPDVPQGLVERENRHGENWKPFKTIELPENHPDRRDFGFTHCQIWYGTIRKTELFNGRTIQTRGQKCRADYFYAPERSNNDNNGWELGAN